MTALAPPQPIPIAVSDHGVWHVEGSRVTVDSIINEFRRGATPEQIQDDFPSLPLAKIYALIGWFLSHTDEIDAYMARQEQTAAAAREESAKSGGQIELRAKLRAARDARAGSVG